MSENDTNILIQWKVESGVQTSSTESPDLTVYADGRVEVGPRFTKGGKVVQGRLSDSDFKALYHFVFEEKNIWSIDSSKLDRDIADAAKERAAQVDNSVTALGTEAIADAGTTLIRVQKGKRVNKISHYNLVADAEEYHEIEELTRLRAIEKRLIELARQIVSSAY